MCGSGGDSVRIIDKEGMCETQKVKSPTSQETNLTSECGYGI